MEATIRPSDIFKKTGFWNATAWAVWTAAVLILTIRPLLMSQRGTSFDTYNVAGLHWIHGENVYAHTQWIGFVYSPVVAVFFAPFASLPVALANIFWRVLNAGALLGGLAALLKTNLFAGIKQRNFGIVFVLLAPLALGNIDVSQANPLIAGLIMLTIAAVQVERWNVAALCVAIATFFKIYPLAVGLLICVIAPRRFTWRLLIALLLLAIAPFFFQRWPYVANQYHEWIATRASDDRRNWPIEKLPLDLWFLFRWLGQVSIASRIYSLIQLGSALALAVLGAFGTWKNWSTARVLTGLFCLASVWMILCGPATESYTYLLLAPPTILALVQSFNAGQPVWLRVWVSAVFALELLAVARASFFPHFKPFWALSFQPLSAVLFLSYCLFWLFNNSFWQPDRPAMPNTHAKVTP
jgi:hypothetical protein